MLFNYYCYLSDLLGTISTHFPAAIFLESETIIIFLKWIINVWSGLVSTACHMVGDKFKAINF